MTLGILAIEYKMRDGNIEYDYWVVDFDFDPPIKIAGPSSDLSTIKSLLQEILDALEDRETQDEKRDYIRDLIKICQDYEMENKIRRINELQQEEMEKFNKSIQSVNFEMK